MPPFLAIFGLLIPVVQIGCALHAYNRGKDRFWFFVILVFPVLGSAIYFFTEVVPELRRSGHLQQWVEKIPWLFGREIERLEDKYLHVIDHFGSEEMRFRLALMLIRQDRSTEARDHFETLKSNIRRGNSDYRRKNRKWRNLTKEWEVYLNKKQTASKTI